MCALYGWLDCGKKLPHRLLKKLTQALANAAEERGTDAAGISYVKNSHVTIYKRPKPAHKIKFNIPENTVAVMGHTRLATQGNKETITTITHSMAKLINLLHLLTMEYCTMTRYSESPIICQKQRLKLTAMLQFSLLKNMEVLILIR